MSSALRLSIIMVLLLATAAIGLIAYGMNLPNAQAPVVQVTEKAPAPLTRYLVAARPLKAGTLTRDEDFRKRIAPRRSGFSRQRLGTGYPCHQHQG